jgi:hypothetical protein
VIPALPCRTEESYLIFVWHISHHTGVLVVHMAMHYITVLLNTPNLEPAYSNMTIFTNALYTLLLCFLL